MMLKTLRIGAVLLCAAIPGLEAQEAAQQVSLADQRQQPAAIEADVHTPHAECMFFTKEGERFRPAVSNPRDPRYRAQFGLSRMTEDVAQRLVTPEASISSNASGVPPIATSKNLIDQYIYKGLQEAGVTPAERTNEYEFVRRVSLDLTGRPPVVERLKSYMADSSPDKRAKFIEELLASPLFVDRWTMYWGDRFKNAQSLPSSGVQRFAEGRDAFYNWIKANVASNKPFDQVARELIATQGTNSWEAEQGPINWIVGGRSSGPAQDTYDQQTVQVATTFLGLSHTNCLLCHNGRGHLTNLSYWGAQTTRYQAWQLAAFIAKTTEVLTRPDPMNNPNRYYWSVSDNPKASDYALNTTTGNRPSRQPTSPTEKTVAPVYFNGNKPAAGESYRVALARELTADPLFATAAVNYMWKEFFGRGIVNPVDQIDPARLDPNNLPSDCADPQPCGIQPSNPYLLTALATDFANNSYDLKGLIRKIVNSETYQLSSRWNGNWNPSLEPLFGRKLVRRLWAEEVSDSIASTSNLPIIYTSPGTTNKLNWAIQLPEPITGGFLGYFLPGNRDDQPRRTDGSVQQALALMNDATVLSRIRATGTGSTASTMQLLVAQGPNDTAIVTNLYMTVLTRPPTDAEVALGLKQLQSGTGATKADKASSLMWALYNKVDFLFNY